MRDIPLQDIITVHTDALAAHAEEFFPTIHLLLLQGSGPVSPERLANAMHWTCSEVEATWPGLHPDAVLLSVEDAAHLAREIANAARWHVEKAGI